MSDARNRYNDDHFPVEWGSEDIAFLAEFIRAEYGDELLATLTDDDYDYVLYD